MEKNIDAVFYEFRYYILPDGMDGVSDGTVIQAKRLREQNCMAPDFIYESIEDETLEIVDRSRLFPVKVNLYSAEEYNKILAEQVKRVCPGCLRFIDDGDYDDLEGHHREISLGGVCYERDDDKGYASYANFVYWFFLELEKRADELRGLIDGGNAEEFDKVCKECCEYVVEPYKFYGEKKDGKYFIFMQCRYNSDEYLTMLAYAAYAARVEGNPVERSGFVLMPYIPEGANGYKGKVTDRTLVGRLEQSSLPWKYNLVISGADANDFYDYLCFNAGEDSILRIIDDITEDDLKGTLLTAEEICDKIKEADGRLPECFPPSLPYGWEDNQTSSPYKRCADGATYLYAFTSACANTDSIGDLELSGEYAYAYVYVPADGVDSDEIYETVSYYLNSEDKVPEPVLLKEDFIFSFMSVGFCECKNEIGRGCAFDFFVAEEKAFYRFIKILAPVLSYYGAKLVVFNENGINEYVCGKDVLPAGGEESN